MKISIQYGSHLPILTKIVGMTDGPILELGIGLYSTPYLHYACLPTKRKLVSYDSSEGWVRYFRDCRTDFHEVNFIDDWDKLPINNFYDVVFVDHAPDPRRSIEAGKMANFAKYVILHDSQPENDKAYNYPDIYPLFKYRYDYTAVIPHTTVLSNFIDLSNFKI